MLRFEVVDNPSIAPLTAAGSNPLPMRPDDVAALSATPLRLQRHPALLWFGLARGADCRRARRGWGCAPRSRRNAARWPPGNCGRAIWWPRWTTGFSRWRRCTRCTCLLAGSFAPVLLRAPYFPQRSDILVSSDQMVLLDGPEVEYLFGEDEVLVPAGALVDGRSAMAEQRRAVAPSVALIFEGPVIVLSDGCALLSAVPGDKPPRRCLEGYEAMTLMALLGRGGQRRRA